MVPNPVFDNAQPKLPMAKDTLQRSHSKLRVKTKFIFYEKKYFLFFLSYIAYSLNNSTQNNGRYQNSGRKPKRGRNPNTSTLNNGRNQLCC